MPLLMMCGIPCSGKSRRVSELCKALEERGRTPIHIVGPEEVAFAGNEVYSEARREKELRGALKASVQRRLSPSELVILDWMNYIKGFRYELFCASKEARTPHAVLWCATGEESARSWNTSHSPEVFDQLCMRFEPPSASQRWDSPLFVLQPNDDLPVDDLVAALYERKAPKPNLSTQSQPLASGNLLFEVDRLTKAIVADVLAAQSTAQPGDKLTVSGTSETLSFTRYVPPAELQRVRRAFLTYSKSRVITDVSAVPTMFVQYLNKSMV